MESRARGQAVPPALLSRALASLEGSLEERSHSLADVRARAYALYLVTKSGVVKANEARSLGEDLRRIDAKRAQRHVAALLLASSLRLLRLDEEAAQWASGFWFEEPVTPDYESYDDALVQRSLGLYLLASHFPDHARDLAPKALDAIVGEIDAGRYQTLSSAL